VFDDQHKLWTNVFASVCVCSSHDAEVTWTKALRKSNTSKEDIKKIKKKVQEVLPQSDCPNRSTGLSGGTPNCPVQHAGLSSAPGTVALMASSRWHRGGNTTGLSGVKSGLSGAKILCANGHLRLQIQRLGAPDTGTGRSGDPTGLSDAPQKAAAFLQRLVLCWGL
jgi:hypothetical protein